VRVELAGISFDDIGTERTVALIREWSADGSNGFVCTPNVDYVVRADRDPDFREALEAARIRVPDGMGVVYGSRIAGRPISQTVTGRLLPEALIGAVPRPADLPIALFGGEPGVAEGAAERLTAMGATVAAAFGPGMNFVVGSSEDARCVTRLKESSASVFFVGLGAPKQEIWMARHWTELPGVLVGIGAGLDVLAGRVPEAPRWMTGVGLEWLFRLAHEPRRLARRYLWDDPQFFVWMLQSRLLSHASRR
jgi:exopolysaccharide biosynthesis WecB/TagA/CpsF family protein